MSDAEAGWVGNLRVADTEVGLATADDEDNVIDVGTDLDGGLKALHQQGSRLPKKINDGLVKMKVTVKKYLKDTTWMGYAGYGQTNMIAPLKYLGVYPQGYAAGKIKMAFYGKFGPHKLGAPLDGQVTEDLDFQVISVTMGTI